jgi:hypothetical protein
MSAPDHRRTVQGSLASTGASTHDDLVEPGFGGIVFSDAAIESRFASQGNPKTKSQASAASSRQTLQSRTGYCAENRFSSSRLFSTRVHDQLRCRVDVEARDADRRHRGQAGWPAPDLPEQI